MLKDHFLKKIPYLLLLFYVVFVSFTFVNIHSRQELMLQQPVKVIQYAREINARIGEMQHTLPGIMSNPDLTNADMVKLLKGLEDKQDGALLKIGQLFKEHPELVENVAKAFVRIRAARREAARKLTGNEDYAQALNIYRKLIAPNVDLVHEATGAIMETANKMLEDNNTRTKREIWINITITIIAGFFVAHAFFLFNKRQTRQTDELKYREKMFNQLSENVNEIFIMAAGATHFIYVTDNSSRIIRINNGEITRNPQIFYDFLPSDAAEWLKQNLSDIKDFVNEQSRLVIINNGARVFRLSVYPVRDSGGSRVIVALQDCTEDFNQKQALNDALERAKAASVAKSSFLSHMSHEIRTPMNAIIGMTTIALNKLGNTERVENCLVKIGESSRHLLGLINDVLDMSKIESGKLSIIHESFSLPQIIHNLNDLIRPQTESKNIEFEIFQENVDEEELLGDALRLNQILINILSNAIKFTPPGGTVTLKIRQLAKSSGSVRLAFIISDTGIGMSEEFLKRLYTPFEQAHATTSAKYGGTGLGMSITFSLVSLMGGTIQVKSREGEGTTFIVDLPFGYIENRTSRADGLPVLKILIVDDDPGTCEHAALLLEKMNMNVRWVTKGAEAVELVREAHDAGAPFNVCLIDWRMPGMDGEETARKIREIAGEDLLIIIISAYDWTPIEEKARAAGVNDFIDKPFFASTIYNALLSTTRRYGVSVQEVSKDTPYFSGKRVLLVEDNEFNREIGQEFLDMVNIEVDHAVNGAEAVEKFVNSPQGYYDLILMDVEMPIMNGYDATRNIRASKHPDAREIHILAMTANAFSEDVAKAIESGMNGHIAKPIDVNELYAKLKAHLG